MESDSDSGGSHISATPPRNPPVPASVPFSQKYRKRIKASSAPKPQKRPPSKPSEDDSPANVSLLSNPNLPFQICHSSVQKLPLLSSHPIETLPAGYFSKTPSFSRIRTASLNFEALVEPNPGPPAGNKPKHPNLVGPSAPLIAVRKPRRSSNGREGNFVKLNMNRRKKSSRRTSAFKKRSRKPMSQAQVGTARDEEEQEGVLSEILQRKPRRGEVFVEEAVLAVQKEASDENLTRLLNAMYGYDSFRDGQLEVIRMVLDGKSTMLVLPTGAGKSLCYQIPAVIFPGITVVVSPLVALMIDQLKQLPAVIRGGLLSSSQNSQEFAETLTLLQEGAIKVLFVSPERFLNAEFLSIFSNNLCVSLLVVDEAHCISEWSHNFRPSYMRIRASLLQANLNVGCILAMTATATTTTLNAVMSALEIPSSNLIQKANLRDNLQLSVSFSGNRMKDLLMLIKSSPFTEIQSIIIYCKFQSDTDIISRYLCDNNICAKSYHSAIPSKDRSRIQELFCSNKIRVVVATVAFGMGLDKSDVGAIIHYSLPESLEEYVQEIGRAGRDGRISYCHLFFDDITYFKLRSLMYSDGVDEYAVNKFLCQVFNSDTNSRGKTCSIIKESSSRKFDMKEEVMLTILTQLELGEVKYLHLLPQLNVTCTLHFYKTSPGLLAEKDIVVSAILKKSDIKQGQYVFDIPTVANSIGVTAIDLSSRLQVLKLKGEITYEVKDTAYCYSIVEVPEDLCSLSAHLTKWLSEVERCKVQKLDEMFDAVVSAVNKCEKIQGCHGAQHTQCLQKRILDYFEEDVRLDMPNKMDKSSPFLRADIKVFLQSNSQAKFTPRAIARILHGIPSPAYPSGTWSKTHFWGRYTQVDFHVVMEAAKAELMNFVGKDAV